MSLIDKTNGTAIGTVRAPGSHVEKPVRHSLLTLLILFFGILYIGVAQAECGGSRECIAVSIDPSVAPAHGTPLTSAPLAFGSQAIGTTSAARSILVGAVSNATGMATLDAITLGGADADQFALTGGTCVTGVPSLPHDGTTCTVELVFMPDSDGVKSADVSISTNRITRRVPLTGFGDEGTLPDPSEDVNLRSVVGAQIDTSKRFSYTQVDNYQRRLQALWPARGSDENNNSRNAAAAGFLVQLASSDSTDLGRLGATDASADARDDYNWWGAGTVVWGTRDESDENQAQRISSDGISIGVDRRFGERFAAGLGLGLGSSDSEIGDNGAGISADATSIAFYAAYRQSPDFQIDGVLGFASLEFDVERYDVVGDAIADSERDGSQWFASLSASYDWSDDGLSMWPYARIDLSNTTLDSVTESGAGPLNLSYNEETYDSNRFSVGLLIESAHATNFGWVTPRLRVELQVEDDGNRDAQLSYANETGGRIFTVSPEASEENRILLGIGSDFNLRNGVQISAEYNGLFSAGGENHESLNFSLSSRFEDRPAPTLAPPGRRGNPVQIEAGYRREDNINRSAEDRDAQSELVFNTMVSTQRTFHLSEYTRFRLRGSLALEDAREHQGLDNISLAARGEWQYRGSAQFSTPTYALFGRLGYDQFDSDLRSGPWSAIGASIAKPFNDRLSLFTALEHRVLDGDNEVFENDQTGIRAVLNLSTGAGGIFRFGAELREGDIVSSAAGSGNLSQISTAQVEDDAYFKEDFIAYRFDGESRIWTLGYNHRLGPFDSIDFAYQKVDSEATDSGAIRDETDYTLQRLSVFYLMSF